MTEALSAIESYTGLGSSGLYGSYYNPYMMSSMMGGYGSIGGYNGYNGYAGYGMTNPSFMGSMGMMGMYNPAFMAQQTEMMKQMYSAQNEIQQMQLKNQTALHAVEQQAQVYNAQVHDRAFFETVAVNGDVQKGIREIYDSIRRGDMDYVAQKYFELKQVILNKYSDHFSNSIGGINDKENIDHFISTLYSEIGGGYNPTGAKPDLRNDILTYGETAFEHGANTSFLGNKGHNKLSAEDCLYQIHGTRVNDAGSKEKAEQLGGYWGRIKEGLCASGVGAAAGAGVWGLGKLFTPSSWTTKIAKAASQANPSRFIKTLSNCGKLGTCLKAGAVALLIGDVIWQMSRD